MANKRLLLVEDDRALADLVNFHFERAGYDVTRTGDGEEALILVDEVKPDLDPARLDDRGDQRDRGLPPPAPPLGHRQRADHHADRARRGGRPHPRARDRRRRLRDQAVQPAELVARVAAVLRRVRPALAGEQLSYADIEMDVAAHRVRRDGKPVPLGPTEFRLLKHFLEHPGRVFSREHLLDAVWSHDPDIDARTVDVHVRRLRQALERRRAQPDLIRTVRSAGYSLDSEG